MPGGQEAAAGFKEKNSPKLLGRITFFFGFALGRFWAFSASGPAPLFGPTLLKRRDLKVAGFFFEFPALGLFLVSAVFSGLCFGGFGVFGLRRLSGQPL